MAPSLHTAAAGQPANTAALACGSHPRPALKRCTRGCAHGRVAVVVLCDGTGDCQARAAAAAAAYDEERATLPLPAVLEYPLLDWSAAMLGDRANLAAHEADLAGVPFCWITERPQ